MAEPVTLGRFFGALGKTWALIGALYLFDKYSPLGWWTFKPRPKEERAMAHLYERGPTPFPGDAAAGDPHAVDRYFERGGVATTVVPARFRQSSSAGSAGTDVAGRRAAEEQRLLARDCCSWRPWRSAAAATAAACAPLHYIACGGFCWCAPSPCHFGRPCASDELASVSGCSRHRHLALWRARLQLLVAHGCCSWRPTAATSGGARLSPSYRGGGRKQLQLHPLTGGSSITGRLQQLPLTPCSHEALQHRACSSSP
ncbi:unnamed protein product [Closterium sp. Naga37s-1]|nr:unnamed protein product [Closterium sp. Naga37s-1]